MVLMNKLQFHLVKRKTSVHFLFWNIYFLYGWCFAKIAPISNIEIMKKGAHLNFSMGVIVHRYASAQLISVLH